MYVKVPQLLILSKGEVWELFDDGNAKNRNVLKTLEKKDVDTLKTLLIYLERHHQNAGLFKKYFQFFLV